MKNLVAIILCTVLLTAAAVPGKTPGAGVQIPNPVVACESLAQAEKSTGFALTTPRDCELQAVQVIGGSMTQVLCSGKNGEFSIRKARGAEDISGDYTVYAQTKRLPVDGADVTVKGEDGAIRLATWTRGDYTYALWAEVPLGADEAAALIAQIF